MGTQDFGGVWTTTKLEVIEKYLAFYTQALKKQKFKLCYIDAFAGSGKVKIKGGEEIDGSALRAINYNFNEFYFFEKETIYYNALEKRIKEDFKDKDVKLRNKDCNKFLMEIDTYDWIKNRWRGVIFLDPYAMQLKWECLQKISNTKAFDVWYLFPFSAVNRNLFKNKMIPEANKEAIYKESEQLSLFGVPDLEKQDTNSIKSYILERLRTIFPTVSDKAILLKNEKNSPVFLLCFAGSNPSPQAKRLSLEAANHILSKI